MRIDKYLWCIRLYKTRSKATEAVRKERVTVNDELAKPSRKVDPGDVVVCRKQGIAYAYRIKALPKSRVGAKWVPDYAVDQTSTEELEKRDFIQLMKKMDRQKGTGRPTKKERRELDTFRQRPKHE